MLFSETEPLSVEVRFCFMVDDGCSLQLLCSNQSFFIFRNEQIPLNDFAELSAYHMPWSTVHVPGVCQAHRHQGQEPGVLFLVPSQCRCCALSLHDLPKASCTQRWGLAECDSIRGCHSHLGVGRWDLGKRGSQ